MDRLAETRHLAAGAVRDVAAALPGPAPPDAWLFLPQATGGALLLPGGRALHWTLHNHATSALVLGELSLAGGQVGRGVRLTVDGQVLGGLAAHFEPHAAHLIVLLASKALGLVTLTPPAAGGGSVLDSLQPGSWTVLPLPGQALAALGVPTALAAADGHLLLGGSAGSVACFPLPALAAAAASGGAAPPPALLSPSTLVAQVRRRMGFAAGSPVVAVLPLELPERGHRSLLAMHADCSVHQWLLGPTPRQGLSAALVPDAASRALRPGRVRLLAAPPRSDADSGGGGGSSSSRAPAWDALLVFDLVPADGAPQSDVRLLPLRLAQAGGGPGAARLEPLAAAPQPLQLEAPDASLLDAALVGGQLLLLCAGKAGGTVVAAYASRDWSYQGRCQLLQQQAGDWGGEEELWAAALDVFPDALDAASHVLSQLLVPGQLCSASLCQALSLHGTQLSEAEVAAASLKQLQARITAAVGLIQARHPTYGAARCWHVLFSAYCAAWQQQHGLLGLWTAPGGWAGAVRNGGLLTVLRRVTPAEVLAQEATPGALKDVLQAASLPRSASIPGGAAALAKVRLCLDAVGRVVGGPALRLMTQLVMAGVPVEGKLLPCFVQLLLQGPPLQQQPATATGFGSSTSAAQQRLLDWRQQRQAQLLFIHEQLAELPHALETLSAAAEVMIRTATCAAAQLRPPPATAPGGGAAAAEPPLQTGALLSSISLHSLRASCCSLQQLLLLLGFLSQLGSVGSALLTPADQGAIAADLLAPLSTALRSTAVALWLCKTPASSRVAGAVAPPGGGLGGTAGLPGPLLGLRNPTPSGTPASTPRGAGPQPQAVLVGATRQGVSSPLPAPCWQYPLAAHLLPLFWKQQGAPPTPGGAVSALGGQLAVWLMLGAGAEAAVAAAGGAAGAPEWAAITGGGASAGGGPAAAAVHAAVTSAEGLAGRGVLLGYQLFSGREYAAMAHLVGLLAGAAPAEAGLQFILGLSLACDLNARAGAAASAGAGSPARLASAAGLGAAAGGGQLDSAIEHLFRAAAGLCGAEAAPLRLVLQLLRQRQGSAGGGGGAAAAAAAAAASMDTDAEAAAGSAGGARAEAQLRLEFAEAVMRLFEAEGVTAGALAFARAALGAVDGAYGPEQQADKRAQQALLWTSVFNFASDLGAYHAAYTAALANPLPERAAESVRRLVQALVDQGELQQLLGLPWSGVLMLQRDGLPEPVPVLELVIDKLSRRALHGDPVARPSAHCVLHDLLVGVGNHKHAACVMLSYARCLRAAGAAAAGGGGVRGMPLVQLLAEVAGAYDAALATLELLAPEDAWLDPEQPLLAPYAAPLPRAGAAASGGQLPAGAGSAAGQRRRPVLPAVLALADVRREAALFHASSVLLHRLPGLEILPLPGLEPGFVFTQLLGLGLFPQALALAHVLWSGAALDERLESIASAVAAAAAQAQAAAADGSGAELADAGSSELAAAARALQGSCASPGPGYLGSGAAVAWRKLRQLLQLYAGRGAGDGAAGLSCLGGRLHLAAIDGALRVQPGLCLPVWLLEPFAPGPATAGGMAGGGADPAGLVRTYVRHGRLVDAAQLVAAHLEAWQRQGPLLRCKAGAVWLPLADLELLHASLVAGAERAVQARRAPEAEALGLWSEVLEQGLQAHVALARSDTDNLRAGRPRAAGTLGMTVL